MTPLEIVVTSRDIEMKKTLTDHAKVRVSAVVENPDELDLIVRKNRPQALLVSLDKNPDAVFTALEKLLEPRPQILFHGPDDSKLILRAMRFGCREYIAPGPDAARQLDAAIDQMARGEHGTGVDKASASVISVAGAKGGVGTSFITCQLATALARSGDRVAILDGQLRHGDIAVYLDLHPRYNIASIAGRSEPLDSTYLENALADHASGVRVLAAPARLEDADSISIPCLDSVIELLRADFDWVVCDTPEDFDERSLYFLDKADVTVLVTTPDVPSLNHAKTKIDLLERLGQSADRIKVLINREDRKAPVTIAAAKEFLGRDIDICIPNDYRRASSCVNEGRTLHDLAPRTPIAKAIDDFAHKAYTWCDREDPAAHEKRGLFGRLRGN